MAIFRTKNSQELADGYFVDVNPSSYNTIYSVGNRTDIIKCSFNNISRGDITELINGSNSNTLEFKNASNGISELMTQTSEVITQGIQSIQGNIGKAQQLQGESTLMATESVAKDTAGGIQVAIGEAMTSGLHSVVTGSTGAKYIMSGNDKINAGATLMQGSTQGLAKLTQSVGSMGSYLTEFTNFAYGIGQVVGGTSELVGQYDTTVNAMISSIGSWDVVSEANDQLQTYVTEYAAELPQEMTEDAEEAPVSTEPNQGSASEETNVNTDAENIFKKFEFDTSIFKATSK